MWLIHISICSNWIWKTRTTSAYTVFQLWFPSNLYNTGVLFLKNLMAEHLDLQRWYIWKWLCGLQNTFLIFRRKNKSFRHSEETLKAGVFKKSPTAPRNHKSGDVQHRIQVQYITKVFPPKLSVFSGPESCTPSSPITKIIINHSVLSAHTLSFTKTIIIMMCFNIYSLLLLWPCDWGPGDSYCGTAGCWEHKRFNTALFNQPIWKGPLPTSVKRGRCQWHRSFTLPSLFSFVVLKRQVLKIFKKPFPCLAKKHNVHC